MRVCRIGLLIAPVIVCILSAGADGQAVPVLGKLPAASPETEAYIGKFGTTDPKFVGRRLILNFLSRPAPLAWNAADRPAGSPGGSRVAAWYGESGMAYGAFRFAELTKDKDLTDRLVARYANVITPEGKKIVPPPTTVDTSIFGIVPMEIFHVTGNKDFLAVGQASADAQFAKLTPEGLSTQTRFWVDDMYMMIILQMQAYRVTGDKVYLERAVKEMDAYIDRLQQPTGLFYHGENAPFYWGRGDGWFAAGMTEVLLDLPADHPSRPHILEGYHKMMAALLKYQDADGMWNQLIDKPEAFKESSGSAMFTYAFVMGVRKGWLDEKSYGGAADKAFKAVCGYLDENANLAGVCEGTGKGTNEPYYLARKVQTGDLHGHEGLMWAAWALCLEGEKK